LYYTQFSGGNQDFFEIYFQSAVYFRLVWMDFKGFIRDYYIYGAVMREKVLVAVTQP
jgi:hypothetical protein